MWEFSIDKGMIKYQVYDSYTNDIIEKAYQNYKNSSGPPILELSHGFFEKGYSLDFDGMFQTNMKTKTKRKIRRSEGVLDNTCFTLKDALKIDRALHSNAKSVVMGEENLKINEKNNSSLELIWRGKIWQTQSPNGNSKFSKMAANGEEITWIISKERRGAKGKIVNGKMEKIPPGMSIFNEISSEIDISEENTSEKQNPTPQISSEEVDLDLSPPPTPEKLPENSEEKNTNMDPQYYISPSFYRGRRKIHIMECAAVKAGKVPWSNFVPVDTIEGYAVCKFCKEKKLPPPKKQKLSETTYKKKSNLGTYTTANLPLIHTHTTTTTPTLSTLPIISSPPTLSIQLPVISSTNNHFTTTTSNIPALHTTPSSNNTTNIPTLPDIDTNLLINPSTIFTPPDINTGSPINTTTTSTTPTNPITSINTTTTTTPTNTTTTTPTNTPTVTKTTNSRDLLLLVDCKGSKKKLSLSVSNVSDLKIGILQNFSEQGLCIDNIKLEYEDPDFSEFIGVQSILEIPEKAKVRVVELGSGVVSPWRFSEEFLKRSGWVEKGFKSTTYSSFCIKDKDAIYAPEEYQKAISLFNNSLSGGGLTITKLYALYNASLLPLFEHYQDKLFNQWRVNPQLFLKDDWKNPSPHAAWRHWIFNHFKEYCNQFEWNKNIPVHVVPMLHGWYGKGMYFTTQSEYAVNYYCKANEEGEKILLLVFVIPGNVYPVIEHPDSEDGLKGKPFQNGYQSHYTVVNNKGLPFSQNAKGVNFTELVVFQEAQIIPKYVLYVKGK